MKRINSKVLGALFILKLALQVASAIAVIFIAISLFHSIGIANDTYAEDKEYIEEARGHVTTEERLEQNAEFQERFDDTVSLWEQYYSDITGERQQILDNISDLEAAHSQE